MILKSTDYIYTTYDLQAILLQITPTPSQPIVNNQRYCNQNTKPTQPTTRYANK